MQEGILIHHAIDMGLSGLECIIVIMCLLLCGYRTVGIEIAICYSYYHKVCIYIKFTSCQKIGCWCRLLQYLCNTS